MDNKFNFSGATNKPSDADSAVKANVENLQSPVKE